MTPEQLQEIKAHYANYTGTNGATIQELIAEVERLQAAIKEVMAFNRLRNDRDAYLLATAEWELTGRWGIDGEFTDRPQRGEFGIEE